MRLIRLITNILLLIVLFTGNINAQRITVTIAGNGTAGYDGDGYPDYLTEINNPSDVCMDGQQNIYFVDLNNRIRKISANSEIVTTVAGGGSSNSDGIPATSASIAPGGLCTDATGNLYFPTGNKIREINVSTGIITTIAGMDSAGYAGDNGLAINAMLNSPQGICIDGTGNIYIADRGNNCVRKVTASTDVITTITDTNGYVLFYPSAVCVNSSGDVYFLSGDYIYMINDTTGAISTIAGTSGFAASGNGGPAINACLGYPSGISIDASGNLYVTELSCSCREINMATGIINWIAGDFSMDGYNGDGVNSLLVWFNQPLGLCVDANGAIYVADQYNNRIRKCILLTNNPSFAYGKYQTINPCSGSAFSIDTQMAITDLDSAQTETWTIISNPINGTLSGFPYSTASLGKSSLVTPAGLSYLPTSGFSGTDSFKICVSDGVLADTVTVYVSVPSITPVAGSISGLPDTLCFWEMITLTETVPGGEWSVTNDNSIIDGSGNLTGNNLMGLVGMDTVTYKVINGCAVSTSSSFYVSFYYNAVFITGNDSLSTGFSTTLSDTISGGSWSSSNSTVAVISSTGIVYGVSTGIDTIWYTLPTPCGPDTTYFALTVISADSINTVTTAITKLAITPNPSTGHFSITLSSSIDEPVTVTISNIIGEKISDVPCITNIPTELSLNVPAGVYILNAKTAHSNCSSKIVIE